MARFSSLISSKFTVSVPAKPVQMRSKGEDAMKKFLSIIALASALGFGVFDINSLSYAEDAAPAATEAAPAAAPAAAEAAPAATDAAAATPAPVPNKGETAWMIVAPVLVIMMTIPG